LQEAGVAVVVVTGVVGAAVVVDGGTGAACCVVGERAAVVDDVAVDVAPAVVVFEFPLLPFATAITMIKRITPPTRNGHFFRFFGGWPSGEPCGGCVTSCPLFSCGIEQTAPVRPQSIVTMWSRLATNQPGR